MVSLHYDYIINVIPYKQSRVSSLDNAQLFIHLFKFKHIIHYCNTFFQVKFFELIFLYRKPSNQVNLKILLRASPNFEIIYIKKIYLELCVVFYIYTHQTFDSHLVIKFPEEDS